MLEISKTYKDRLRRKGPQIKVKVGMFEATGKNKTEAKTAIESDIAWYVSQNPTPEIRLAPDGSAWVLVADTHGYSYYTQRDSSFPGSSHMGEKDATSALVAMLTHMCDIYPEETWESFLYGLTNRARERIKAEINHRDKLRSDMKDGLYNVE